jgi:hypothetical protein
MIPACATRSQCTNDLLALASPDHMYRQPIASNVQAASRYLQPVSSPVMLILHTSPLQSQHQKRLCPQPCLLSASTPKTPRDQNLCPVLPAPQNPKASKLQTVNITWPCLSSTGTSKMSVTASDVLPCSVPWDYQNDTEVVSWVVLFYAPNTKNSA